MTESSGGDFSPLNDLALTGGRVDRMTARRTDDDWLQQRWDDPRTRVLPVADGKATAMTEAGVVHLGWRPPNEAPKGERYLLGVGANNTAYFAIRVDSLPEDEESGDLRHLATSVAADEAQLLAHAIALANWHAAHIRCPQCGEPTEPVAAGAERRCVSDGTLHFPRTDPAVIMLVTDPTDRALLGRQAVWPEGRYSTLAGFVEPGESAEQAVIREVAEESGVVVTDVRYLGSQPWPFPASLMLGFTARATEQQPIADGEELSDVRWFSRDEFGAAIASGTVVAPGGISISRRLIERWFGSELPEAPADAVWR